MRAIRDRSLGLSWGAAAVLAACSVFPEEAVLPAPLGGSGTVGEGGVPGSDGGAGLGAGAGGSVSLGGSSAGGSSSAGVGGSAGGELAGEAGAGGSVSPACAEPEEYSASTTLDLWVGAADPSVNNGKEGVLYVSGGADERRAMFSVGVPAAPPGAVLLQAEIVLSLESNADTSLAARRLGLYVQSPLRAVVETKATWEQFGSNKNQDVWDVAGGDLGERVATADIAAGTESGLVRFDVTQALSEVLDATARPYGVVVLEEGPVPEAPAQLAFTSREGNASVSPAPALRIRYCPP